MKKVNNQTGYSKSFLSKDNPTTQYTNEAFIDFSRKLLQLSEEHEPIRKFIAYVHRDSYIRNGTGFVIDNKHVLTAAHNLFELKKDTKSIVHIELDELTVYLSLNGLIASSDPSNCRKVVRYYYPKQLDQIEFYQQIDKSFNKFCYDYVLLELDEEVDFYSNEKSNIVQFDQKYSKNWNKEIIKNLLIYGYPCRISKDQYLSEENLLLIGQVGMAKYIKEHKMIQLIANTQKGTSGGPYFRFEKHHNIIKYYFIGIHVRSREDIENQKNSKNYGLHITKATYLELKNHQLMSSQPKNKNSNISEFFETRASNILTKYQPEKELDEQQIDNAIEIREKQLLYFKLKKKWILEEKQKEEIEKKRLKEEHQTIVQQNVLLFQEILFATKYIRDKLQKQQKQENLRKKIQEDYRTIQLKYRQVCEQIRIVTKPIKQILETKFQMTFRISSSYIHQIPKRKYEQKIPKRSNKYGICQSE